MKKPTLFNRRRLKQTVLAVPAAAMMLGASHGAQVGINFQADWSPYTSYSGKPVTATALDIDATNWFNLTPVSTGAPSTTSETITLAGGRQLMLKWTALNAYTSSIDADGTGTNVPPGIDEVLWAYLDDTGSGYSVTISGFRALSSDYTLQTISASDNATGFSNVRLTTLGGTQDLNYTNDPGQFMQVGGAAWATSTVSTAYVTLNGNDSITLKGLGRNGSVRSTLAGLILSYTPGNNAPLVEANPQAPTNTIFSGQSFSLSVTASGTDPLSYQWRQGGVPIPSATASTYSKAGVTGGDSGNYDVVITNAYGAVTSAVAMVNISSIEQPVVVTGPTSLTRYANYPASFSVAATGGQLGYQWLKNAAPIPGATGSNYTIASVVATNSGAYSVIVSNAIGTAMASATLTVKVPVPGTYEAASAYSYPQVYMRMSETGALSQDTAANTGSLGGAGTGLYLGGAMHPVSGAIASGNNTAAYLNGSSAQVSVPYNAALNTAIFTAEGWFKPDVALSGTTLTCALSCGDFANPRAGWLIYQSATGWDFRMYNQNGLTVSVDITGGTAPVPGQWYHLAVSYDGTTANVYVNGVLSISGTPTGYVPGIAGPMAVGARADSTFYWQGAADEVALYSTALTPSRILAHYQAGTNAAPAMSYNTVVLADSPVEYLRLGESAFSPTKAQNLGLLGPVADGSYTPTSKVLGGDIGMTLGADGPRMTDWPGFESTNIAVSMNNGYVNLDPLLLATNTVTFVCWVKRASVQPGDLSGLIFERSATEASGFHMLPGGELRYHWNGGQYDWSSGLFLPDGQWAFAALVVEPTKATIYMDDGTGLVSSVHTATHASVAFTSPLRVGYDQGTRNFSGEIDEVGVYKRALTANEISALDLAATGRPILVQLVPGGIIQDTKPVGAPHHGYNHGATWVDTDTDFNSVTRTGLEQFSATTGNQIVVPADPDFNSTTGTIMFWMRVGAPLPPPGSEGAILFDRRTTTGDVIVLHNDGSIFVQAKGTSGTVNSFSAGYLPDDTWHHVAYVYDQGAAGSISIYVDGTLYNSNPNSAAWSWPAAQQIEIGRSHDGYWERYDGKLDDFRIYNRVLTTEEIAQAFSSGALVDTAALKLRFNFDNVGIGNSVVWQYGTLESSSTLAPGSWTTVTNATSPYSILPAPGSAMFFRTRLP